LGGVPILRFREHPVHHLAGAEVEEAVVAVPAATVDRGAALPL
jgi:hypothetical protein